MEEDKLSEFKLPTIYQLDSSEFDMNARYLCFHACCGVVALAMLPALSRAEVRTIYNGEQGDLTADLADFDATQDLGDAFSLQWNKCLPVWRWRSIRVYDNNSLDKPELQGEFAAPLTGAFRLDFQSLNQSTVTDLSSSNGALRWRMANTGASITSGADRHSPYLGKRMAH